MGDDLTEVEKITFLLEPASLKVLEAIGNDIRDDLALSQSTWLKTFSAPQRVALLEQRALRKVAARKNSLAAKMLLTRLGFEQMTQVELAKYKMQRLPKAPATVMDLCCGVGGDAMNVPPQHTLIGVDWNLAALKTFKHNVGLTRQNFLAIRADAAAPPLRADYVFIDPARRTNGSSDNWNTENLSPSWDIIKSIISRYENVAIKLGPGMNPPIFLEAYEWEYLGLRDECLELVIWTGSLGQTKMLRATELPGSASFAASRQELKDFVSSVDKVGAYLYEPVKALIRSHLFGLLAAQLGLWLLDEHIAYLSGNSKINHPLLKSYQVICELPFNIKEIQKYLRKNNIGRLEIKKRGVEILPETLRGQLKLVGSEEGVIILARIGDKKCVYFAQRVKF